MEPQGEVPKQAPLRERLNTIKREFDQNPLVQNANQQAAEIMKPWTGENGLFNSPSSPDDFEKFQDALARSSALEEIVKSLLSGYDLFPLACLPSTSRKLYQAFHSSGMTPPPLTLDTGRLSEHVTSDTEPEKRQRSYILKTDPQSGMAYFETCTKEEAEEALKKHLGQQRDDE